jgi:hypothetical protein
MRHHKEGVLGWVFFAVICIGIGWFAHQYFPDFSRSTQRPAANTEQEIKKADEGEYCAKIITPAINPETGEIQEFPTTCSVPEGWELIENDIPELGLEVQ